jgi:hypothetical protein
LVPNLQYLRNETPSSCLSPSIEEVRFYGLGTQIADTVDAVLRPSHGGDEVLRTAEGAAADQIARSKAIVNEWWDHPTPAPGRRGERASVRQAVSL